MMKDEETSLYRHYDKEGRLLYVGISNNHLYRLSQHAVAAGWFREIATITIEHLPSRKEALAHEAEAIAREKPIHNAAPGRPWKPEGEKLTKRVVVMMTEAEREKVRGFVDGQEISSVTELMRTALFEFMAERGRPIRH